MIILAITKMQTSPCKKGGKMMFAFEFSADCVQQIDMPIFHYSGQNVNVVGPGGGPFETEGALISAAQAVYIQQRRWKGIRCYV